MYYMYVNVVMRHPKRAGFLNPAPDSFKQFQAKAIFHHFMKNSKFLIGFLYLAF